MDVEGFIVMKINYLKHNGKYSYVILETYPLLFNQAIVTV